MKSQLTTTRFTSEIAFSEMSHQNIIPIRLMIIMVIVKELIRALYRSKPVCQKGEEKEECNRTIALRSALVRSSGSDLL